MSGLVELYCSVEDFWNLFKTEWDKHLICHSKNSLGPEPELSVPDL